MIDSRLALALTSNFLLVFKVRFLFKIRLVLDTRLLILNTPSSEYIPPYVNRLHLFGGSVATRCSLL